MRLNRVVGTAAVSLVLGVTGFAAGPADAAQAVVPQRPAVCLSGSVGPVPTWRSLPDHDPVSARTLVQINNEVKAHAALTAWSATVRTAPRPVNVQIHVIRGTHRKDRKITRPQARAIFRHLKAGFAGKQNPSAMGSSGFNFRLARITMHRNDRWFHSLPGSAPDKRMHRRLYRGNARTLHIYIKDARIRAAPLLGVARFPWQRAKQPKQDGITVNVAGLPGGAAKRYNLGDTVIHETGHWLGLLHTFEGGCTYPNDGVSDTPAEAAPNYRCPEGFNSCVDYDDDGNIVDDGPDPIHNFMDYSYDTCMNHFTAGQISRMKAMYDRYRPAGKAR